MKKLFILFFSIATATTIFAQKTINDANAEKRSASGYHAIEVSNGIDLYLSQGEESVAVSASEAKFRDKIMVEVKDGVLKIWYDYEKGVKMNWNTNRKLKAYVSYNSIDRLNGSGGSDIDVDGSIKSNNFALNISGGSDFKGKIEATDLKIHASGGSDIDIAGSARTLDMEVSGGSDFDGYEMNADVCNLNASGGSDVNITINKELNADASGGSDISYRGNGSVKKMQSSGSSSIRKGR